MKNTKKKSLNRGAHIYDGETTKGPSFIQKVGTAINDFNNMEGAGTLVSGIGNAIAPVVTGGNKTTLGNIGMGVGSAVAMVNPAIGAAIMGASMLGNAAFGSNINNAQVDAYNNQISNLMRTNINARDNANLLNQISGLPSSININKSSLGTQGWFNHKLDNTYNDLAKQNAAARASLGYKVSNAVSNVDRYNDALIAANYAAYGGPLFGYLGDGAMAYDVAKDNFIAKQMEAQNKAAKALSDNALAYGGMKFPAFDNGIVVVGAGGTHGQNPFGGVPMGIAPDGQPNLVEEGEVIFKDYVYSNRLKVPKSIKKKYKLRKDTFADAMQEWFRKNGVDERENDPIIKNGLDAFAMDLALSQEQLKMKKQARQTGIMAEGGHLFPYGGPYIGYDRDMGTENYEDSSDYMRALEWLKQAENIEELKKLQTDITNRVYDDPEGPNKINGVTIDDSNWYRLATDRKVGPVHNAIMKWAEANRNLWDTPEGAAVRESLGLPIVTMKYQGDATGRFDRTGRQISPEFGVFTDIDSARGVGEYVPKEIFQRGDIINQLSYDDSLKEPSRLSKGNEEPIVDKGKGWLEKGLSGFARNAGLLANLYGLAYNLNDPYRPAVLNEVGPFQPITANPIGDYVPTMHIDTNYEANQLAQQAAATRDAIMQSNLPSRNQAMLAADFNAQVARGNLLRDAALADYDLGLKKGEFNRGTNQYNSQLGFNVGQTNMQGRQYNQAARMQQGQFNTQMYDQFKRGRDQAIGAGITGLANWFDAARRDSDARNMLAAVAESGALELNDPMRKLLGSLMMGGGKLNKKRRK